MTNSWEWNRRKSSISTYLEIRRDFWVCTPAQFPPKKGTAAIGIWPKFQYILKKNVVKIVFRNKISQSIEKKSSEIRKTKIEYFLSVVYPPFSQKYFDFSGGWKNKIMWKVVENGRGKSGRYRENFRFFFVVNFPAEKLLAFFQIYK